MPKALFKIVLLAFFGLHAFEDVNASPFSDKSPIILQSQSFGVPQGLSQSTVTSIVQDHDGYLWIGTFNGLNRFDGKTLSIFMLMMPEQAFPVLLSEVYSLMNKACYMLEPIVV